MSLPNDAQEWRESLNNQNQQNQYDDSNLLDPYGTVDDENLFGNRNVQNLYADEYNQNPYESNVLDATVPPTTPPPPPPFTPFPDAYTPNFTPFLETYTP